MESFWDSLTQMPWWGWLLIAIVMIAVRDIFLNRKHTIQHNFPVVGHIRYFLESIGPELRQYIVANNRCPSGVATQSKWRQNGINIADKSNRTHFYFKNFRKELLEITHACGYEHPCQLTMDDVEFSLGDKNLVKTLSHSFGYHKTRVEFDSVQSILECPHLGGSYKAREEQEVVKEAMARDELRY